MNILCMSKRSKQYLKSIHSCSKTPTWRMALCHILDLNYFRIKDSVKMNIVFQLKFIRIYLNSRNRKILTRDLKIQVSIRPGVLVTEASQVGIIMFGSSLLTFFNNVSLLHLFSNFQPKSRLDNLD